MTQDCPLGSPENIMTRETLLARKDSLMDIVNSILEMAVEDDEFESIDEETLISYLRNC